MKFSSVTTTIISASLAGAAFAADSGSPSELRAELERAIEGGNSYLKSQQDEAGFWDDDTVPALTALALSAAVRDPNRESGAELPAYLEKGYEWLLARQQDDGGVYVKGYAAYNTATTVMALLARGREADVPAILRARAYLVGQQTDWDTAGETDNPYDGGTGYGSSDVHSDLSNTLFALEALYHSRPLVADGKHGEQPELDWEAALTFVSRCQNLNATNDQDWASDNPEDKGGFIYYPGETKAGERELEDGRTALRSYGSISYAGLLSLVYADLDEDDPRVAAVLEWLGKNYTLDENPGMGLQGLYYYYQAMAKSLAAAKIDRLELADGPTIDWRRELADRLLDAQKADGSWINENSRWMENNPVLVTSYIVLALEALCSTIPE